MTPPATADTGRHRPPDAHAPTANARAEETNHGRSGDYDVIIIGSGAGGGTLAHQLAPSGKRILILERGDWLPREPENWDSTAVFVDNRYVPEETWYDEHGKPFQPGVHYWVGGATKLYGAALYRLRRQDFGELRHHDGISPAWPISYAEMEPWYTAAEQLYEVHGARGEDTDRGPARARRTRSRRWPTSRASSSSRMTWSGPGCTPSMRPAACGCWPTTCPTAAASGCQTCDGFPCLVQAKSDAEMLGVRPALEHPNVTLRDQRPRHAAADQRCRHGRHRGRGRPGRRDRHLPRRTSWSCRRAPPTPRALLLASATDQHPDGLANGSGQVGRNYMFHNSVAVLAISKEPNPTRFQKTLGLNDFYFGMPGFEYPMGNIQMVGKSDAEMFKGEKPLETKLAPMFSLSRGGHPLGRLLAVDRGPAQPRQPGHARRGRQASS